MRVSRRTERKIKTWHAAFHIAASAAFIYAVANKKRIPAFVQTSFIVSSLALSSTVIKDNS